MPHCWSLPNYSHWMLEILGPVGAAVVDCENAAAAVETAELPWH